MPLARRVCHTARRVSQSNFACCFGCRTGVCGLVMRCPPLAFACAAASLTQQTALRELGHCGIFWSDNLNKPQRHSLGGLNWGFFWRSSGVESYLPRCCMQLMSAKIFPFTRPHAILSVIGRSDRQVWSVNRQLEPPREPDYLPLP